MVQASIQMAKIFPILAGINRKSSIFASFVDFTNLTIPPMMVLSILMTGFCGTFPIALTIASAGYTVGGFFRGGCK